MKFYIASRTKKANQVKEINQKLKSHGHSIIFDWTKQPNLRPYDKNLKKSVSISKKSLSAIKNCDFFILLTGRAGTGMHTEFGIALAENKKIFVLGKNLNTNIFFFHPNVKKLSSFAGLMKELV